MAELLHFRQRAGAQAGRGRLARPSPVATGSPVEDIGKYERAGAAPDDYRHRMLVNVLGFAFSVALIAAGIWLAIKIAELRRDQDCVLAGRRNCANLSIVGNAARYP